MRKINKKKFKTLLKENSSITLRGEFFERGAFFEFFTLYIEHLKNDYHIITINYFNDKKLYRIIYTCIYNCDIEEFYNKFINKLFLKFEVYA
jgi:hypothetical protein